MTEQNLSKSYFADSARGGVNRMFLYVFFALLFLPLLGIRSGVFKLDDENRWVEAAAKLFSPPDKPTVINPNFSNEFEKWFADHIAIRKPILRMLSKTQYAISVNYRFGDYIHYKGFIETIKPKTDNVDSNEENLKINDDNLAVLEKFCDARKIKCYVLLADRDTVAMKYDALLKNMGPQVSKIKSFCANISKHIPVVCPIDEILAADDTDDTLYRTDHHYTDWGVFIAYMKLMKTIQADFPKIAAVRESDYDTYYKNTVRGEYNRSFTSGGDCTSKMIAPVCKLDIEYKYYDHKKREMLQETRNTKDNEMEKLYHYDNGANKRVVIIGDSFTESLMQFLPYTFNDILKLRINGNYKSNNRGYNERFSLERWKEKIDEFKPDIMILYTGYSNQIRTIGK